MAFNLNNLFPKPAIYRGTTVADQRLTVDGTAGGVQLSAFADTTKMTCNVEYLLDGSTDICWHYNEVLFPLDQQSISEAEDGVTVSLNGMCYGTVVRDAAFTTGTSVET